ncbi:MAG TPA: hypothetical protein PLU22_12595, partial [Polyangiaceae bacterium]|nr:hypothetical protein [Polyangiaceae bacterium]
ASPSPAYHAAVSRAIGDLALDVLPTVVEEEHLGKIIYAGGDDLLAMVSVTDLLSLLARLREVYRGEQPANQATTAPLKVGSGHVLVNAPHKSGRRRLLRVMGNRATISVGAVVAHHMTPLAAVLSDLRAAEGRAKQAGRDAVSITLAKRSGGTTHITVPYVAGREQTACQPLRVIERLRGALSNELSRRAAYHLMSQLPSLPSQLAAPELQALLGATAAYQLQRQSRSRDRERLEALAALGRELVATTVVTADKLADANAGGDWTPTRVLEDWLRLAEFLARTERADGNDQEPK